MTDSKIKILQKDIVIYRNNKKVEVFSLSKEEKNFLVELKRIFNLDNIEVAENV